MAALERWVRVKAERAAAHYSGIGKRGADASNLAGAYIKGLKMIAKAKRRSNMC